MKESRTTYSYLIEHMQEPSFQKIWDIAFDFVRKLPSDLCDELHESLNRGVDVLDSEPLLQMYIYAFGKMHNAKLQYAFEHLQKNVFNRHDSQPPGKQLHGTHLPGLRHYRAAAREQYRQQYRVPGPAAKRCAAGREFAFLLQLHQRGTQLLAHFFFFFDIILAIMINKDDYRKLVKSIK